MCGVEIPVAQPASVAMYTQLVRFHKSFLVVFVEKHLLAVTLVISERSPNKNFSADLP